mmetsp:Transcript_12846/g.27889  ORF Transcript_12846/g.27889 Transcript_12846/m.27889 type:complete len:181 (+) Transcript_12846:1281-1823(+)
MAKWSLLLPLQTILLQRQTLALAPTTFLVAPTAVSQPKQQQRKPPMDSADDFFATTPTANTGANVFFGASPSAEREPNVQQQRPPNPPVDTNAMAGDFFGARPPSVNAVAGDFFDAAPSQPPQPIPMAQQQPTGARPTTARRQLSHRLSSLEKAEHDPAEMAGGWSGQEEGECLIFYYRT